MKEDKHRGIFRLYPPTLLHPQHVTRKAPLRTLWWLGSYGGGMCGGRLCQPGGSGIVPFRQPRSICWR